MRPFGKKIGQVPEWMKHKERRKPLKWRVVFSNGVELEGDRERLHKRLFRDGYRIAIPENICEDKQTGRTLFLRPLRSGRTDKLIGVILEYVDDSPTVQ